MLIPCELEPRNRSTQRYVKPKFPVKMCSFVRKHLTQNIAEIRRGNEVRGLPFNS